MLSTLPADPRVSPPGPINGPRDLRDDRCLDSTKAPTGSWRDFNSHNAPERIELAGPVAAKLCIESSTTDADLFLILRAFGPDGTEIVCQGANDPYAPIAQGWLRASHRALDFEQSRPFLPVHRHDRAEALDRSDLGGLAVDTASHSPDESASMIRDAQGHNYVYPGATGMLDPHYRIPLTGCGLFLQSLSATQGEAHPAATPDAVHVSLLSFSP